MKLGIVGLPNVGKSTLFNSLTKAGAESANYPFCTIDPNVGVVTVPDKRLDVLGEMYHTKKIIPAAIEFVDIAGLVKGASKGEGLGNQFLANIREVDAIVHVVRCFENTNIVHVDGSIDPLRDIETINLELIFSDLEVLERRIAKTVKLSRNDKTAAKELDLLQRLKAHLEDNKMAKSFTTDDEDEQACRRMHKKVFNTFPISRVYQAHIPTSPSGYWLFGFASKKYHPLADFKPEEWKKLQIPTEYYTCNLHTGAFMLPKYVEELLEEEEKR